MSTASTRSTTGTQLREAFIRYFAERGHAHVASASLLPKNDPTLLFTNAGMVQFKDLFVGVEQRAYTRAVTSQKCLRLSGKHNDLENVGHTARHNTFFEMLGNFSFGDYFKEEAIAFAWEFLTKTVGLPTDRLVVSVFGGDPEAPGVPPDDEARQIWKKVTGFPDERIIGLGLKDNFWQMGETGPCGPCTEIHYFLGNDVDLSLFGLEPTLDGRGWTEIWNNVFMQFERYPDGSLKPLPKPSVDTGMGLERLAMVVQGVRSNYETDLMFPLIRKAEELTGKTYGKDPSTDVSMRILADHARAVTFLLGDGLLPSNEKQGYVLRKVLRRALRHGWLLGFQEPFFTKFTDTVIEMFESGYPELREGHSKISRIVHGEEVRFSKALGRGLELLEQTIAQLKARGETTVPGAEVFRLYDTFGFPLDLTVETAKDHGMHVDEAGYRAEMEGQKTRARDAWQGEAKVDPYYRDLVMSLPTTEFLGYTTTESEASRALALLSKGRSAEALEAGMTGEVVLDRTPFYAEAGGQVGDEGWLVWEGGEAKVLDAHAKIPGYTFHSIEVVQGRLTKGIECKAHVNVERRDRIRLNHTATHLLHAALRELLGEHVKQKGSLVTPDRLRFDFTHFAPLEPQEIEDIEELANRKIRENIQANTEVMDLDAAIKSGAMALFEEKYGDRVRVLKIGDFSTELCGGTHARRTGDIGLVKIISEESVSAGVRRLEAVTGPGALERIQRDEGLLRGAAQKLNVTLSQVPERLELVLRQLRAHEKEIETLKNKLASGAGNTSQKLLEISGVQVLSRTVEELGGPGLRNLADELKAQVKSGVVLLVNRHPDKLDVIVTVTDDLTSKLDAGAIVRAAAAPLGGKGGGRRDFAQAGGKDVGKLEEALQAGFDKIKAQLA